MVSAADREFLHWLAQAAFANPFSEQRYELDLKITGTTFKNEDERERFLQRAVSERIQKLSAAGKADLRLYTGADHELMRVALLFEVFHQFYDRLDQCIRQQVKAGDTPIGVPFASEALDLLARRGFFTDRRLAILWDLFPTAPGVLLHPARAHRPKRLLEVAPATPLGKRLHARHPMVRSLFVEQNGGFFDTPAG
jgi:hypothetical protein